MEREITLPQRSETMGLRGQRHKNMTDAIIPTLMHRIPSELRSEACLGESSTRMGDRLGSPRVAPLFLVLRGTIPACHLSSQWVRPSPSPSAPGDRPSGHPIARYGPSKARV